MAARSNPKPSPPIRGSIRRPAKCSSSATKPAACAILNVAYCIADKDGNLVSEQWFEQPYLSTIHDFVITEKYAIFPIFPTLADLDRIKAGGAHWAHRQDLESWVGIMPRYGKVEEMQWIKGPVGVSVFHEVNAYDDGDLVHIDLCLSETNAFAFMREAGGINIAAAGNPGRR